MSAQLDRYKFDVDAYYRLAEIGILKPDERVELIEGQIIQKAHITPPHAACTARLNMFLHERMSQSAIVSIHNPVRLNEYSEPEPDVALLRRRADFYAEAHPKPADTLMIIEVADATVDFDRKVKVPLYARSAIPEVWLIDLQQETIELYAQPMGGAYQIQRQARRGAQLTAETIPQLSLDVDAVLG